MPGSIKIVIVICVYLNVHVLTQPSAVEIIPIQQTNVIDQLKES